MMPFWRRHLIESLTESGGAVVMRSLILLASNDAWAPNSSRSSLGVGQILEVSHNSEFGFEYVGTDRYGMLTYLYVRL
jgi:hypothetical protein